MTDETNFFWLAGLLEGEGSFLRPSPSRPYEPKVDVEMTDEDVIRRVATLLGVSYRKRDRGRPKARMTYHVRVVGGKAVALMWRLKPYLSARRQAQITRAIEAYAARGPKYHPFNLPPYELHPVCAHALCANSVEPGSDRCAAHCAGQLLKQAA